LPRRCRSTGQAQPIADFYRGKTVESWAPPQPAATTRGRTLANHMGRHIGQSKLIRQHAGATGLIGANYLQTSSSATAP
jgi:hypothetical protein